MKKKIIALLSIGILSFNLVACSNEDSIVKEELSKKEVLQEETLSEKMDNEEILFDEEIVIIDGDVTVTVKGKSKITPGNSVGYIYKVSNMSDENIEFYVKGVEVEGVEFKTDLDESFKMSLQSLTDFSTQMTVTDITSVEDLKNTKGIFCIKTNDNIKEYKFELE